MRVTFVGNYLILKIGIWGYEERAFHLFLPSGSPSMGGYGRSRENLQPHLHRVCIWSQLGNFITLQPVQAGGLRAAKAKATLLSEAGEEGRKGEALPVSAWGRIPAGSMLVLE